MSATALELDLDVFQGPFDLLLTLVLREELDLLEVDLAAVVCAYLDHLDAVGGLELESATEVLLLIAGLLELKSRLLLPGADELDDLELPGPGEAVEELLARLLAYARHRGAAGWLQERLDEEGVWWYRAAPLPGELRREAVAAASATYDPGLLGRALGALLRVPEPVDVSHLGRPRVAVADRLRHLRSLLAGRSGAFDFEDAVRGEDRVTVAVTVWALLELHRRGEAAWEQGEPFGPIRVVACAPAAGAAA